MKINKITLIASALMIAITAQPAYGMYECVKKSFNNNPYVKYGTAVVAGVGIGAGLVYYLTSQSNKPTQSIKPELNGVMTQTDVLIRDQETQTDTLQATIQEFKEITLTFDVGEKTYSDNLEIALPTIAHTFWAKITNLGALKMAKEYTLQHVGTEGICLMCDGFNRVDLRHYKPTEKGFNGDIFSNQWIKVLGGTYIATQKDSRQIDLTLKHLVNKL
jgi:hypothetical protein